ncbi:MAG: hypothetical protein NTV34_08700 [Proteobacteria bacterium]|nr:hypothetical protein [Pseudomonadota bacterium]
MKITRSPKKLGQNTAEYMLLLLLIGGASIFAFKTFGKGIINRFASVTSILTGGAKVDGTAIGEAARTNGNKDVDFKTFDDSQNGSAGGTTPP